jgi:hypothetical protein
MKTDYQRLSRKLDMIIPRKYVPKILILFLLVISASGCSLHVDTRGLEMDRAVSVSIHRLEWNYTGKQSSPIGRLRFIGGVELSSPDRRFGGFSGMAISQQGDEFWAVSDKGNWLSAKLRLGGDGLPIKFEDVKIAPLLMPDGAFVMGKSQGDAEELATAPGGGMIVAFERRHRLLIYPPKMNPLAQIPTRLALPPWLINQKANRGVEAMTFLANGMLLVVAEGDGGAETPAGLWNGSSWSELRYACRPGLKPTAAALLPSGDVIFLERGFSPLAGLSVRMVLVQKQQIFAGALLKPRLLADLSASLSMIDNFEALAVRPSPRGAHIYMLSDDNFSAMQKNLLLLFELDYKKPSHSE